MRNGFHIIDSHCHIYPEKIAERAIAGTDSFYGVVSTEHGTGRELIEKSEQYGIDRFVVQSVATTAKQVKSINEFIAGEVERSCGRFIGLGTLYPDSPDLQSDYMHLKELGLHGVKLHPDIQDFRLDDPRCHKIYELCEADDTPILIHTGDSRYDNSNPNRLCPILEHYRGLRIIGAHLGGYSIWDEATEKLVGYDNLYVDCSSSFAFISMEKAREIILAYGADRVLFGTDYPMWPPSRELDTLFSMGFSDEDMEKILSLNSMRVFNF